MSDPVVIAFITAWLVARLADIWADNQAGKRDQALKLAKEAAKGGTA